MARDIFFGFIFLFFSCKQSATHSENNQPDSSITNTAVIESAKDSFETGKVIDPVTNKTEPSQSFALYLPKNYSASNTYPVIYFFDSHASGRLPLDKYFSLADEFKFILIGSNNSKNGMQPDALMNIANNLMNDAQKRFSINPSRIYVAGFSGGARVAGMIAAQAPNIAGVIACSAGLQVNGENGIPYAVVGIAGKEDFNMTELAAMNKQLDGTDTDHQLLLFNGKHEWCPEATMRDAFLFLELNAMRWKNADKNFKRMSEIRDKIEIAAHHAEYNHHYADAASAYQTLINYLKDLQDVSHYQKALDKIKQNKNYQNEIAKQDQLNAQENQLREHYMQSFGKEITWWKTEISRINDEIKKQGKSDEAFMLKRMLGSLSLASYMQANSAINANELDKANYILQIYQLVDPTNSEAWYLSAKVHAKQGNKTIALTEIKKAIENGFKERERMMQEVAFNSFTNEAEFIALLNHIHE